MNVNANDTESKNVLNKNKFLPFYLNDSEYLMNLKTYKILQLKKDSINGLKNGNLSIFSPTEIRELKNNLTPIDVLFAGLPAGTVSGAPKIRALEILEKHEDINREFYSGSVFYLDANGDMDSCINLRTAMIKNKKIYAQSGAGIVFDSIPENEHSECINKANALFEAYNLAHNI